jgi:O-antigen/teichoic acid export membrane protein
MLEKIKKTVSHSLVFSLGALGTKLVGFILLPIYTNELPPEAYGILGLLEMVDLLGVHFMSFALHNALFRWYTLSGDTNKRKQYVFTIVVFLLMVIAVSLLLVIPARRLLSNLLFETAIYSHLLLFTMGSISLQVIGRIQLTLLRIEEKSFTYIKVVVSQFVLSLLLNILFVVYLGWKVEGILLAQVISYGMVIMLLLPYLLRKMIPRLVVDELKQMLAFSTPVMIAAIAATLLSMGDRFFLTRLSELTAVGLYALGYKLTNVIKVFVIDPFLLGFPIVGWRVVKEDQNPKRYFAKVMTYFVMVLTWLSLGIAAFSSDVIHTFVPNPAYWDAQKVIPLLAMGIVMMGVQRAFLFILQIPKATQTIPVIVGISAVINFALNWLLIPHYNFMGAAYANVSANLFGALLAYQVVQKHYPMRFEVKRLLLLLVTGVLLYGLTLWCNQLSLIPRVLSKGMLIMMYPVWLYGLNFYEAVEVDRIRGSLKKWLGKAIYWCSGKQ